MLNMCLLTSFVFLLMLLMLQLLHLSAYAEERPEKETQKEFPRKINLEWKGPDKTPSKELLEFLAEWETPGGEWVSPQEITQLQISEHKNETTNK